MTKLSITIPAYNEEVTLEEVIGEALAAGRSVVGECEVLIVDDGSTDGTAELAERLAREHPEVRVVHHLVNRGFSGAMLSCMENARGDYVFLGPADGQASYDDLARFWELIDTQDLIFSERVERGDAAVRKLSSTIWYAFLRLLFGVRFPQFSSTFLFRRDELPHLPVRIRSDASNFLPMLYMTARRDGRRVATLGVDHGPRRGGTAKGGNLANSARTVREDVVLWWKLRAKRRPAEPAGGD